MGFDVPTVVSIFFVLDGFRPVVSYDALFARNLYSYVTCGGQEELSLGSQDPDQRYGSRNAPRDHNLSFHVSFHHPKPRNLPFRAASWLSA